MAQATVEAGRETQRATAKTKTNKQTMATTTEREVLPLLGYNKLIAAANLTAAAALAAKVPKSATVSSWCCEWDEK